MMFTPRRSAIPSFETLSIPAVQSGNAKILLVLLPGINVTPEDFVAHGIVAAIADSGRVVDCAAVSLSSTDYLDDDFPRLLHERVIALLSPGYSHIALLGLSLGALGAVHYLRTYGAGIDEFIMLAPFLGTPGVLAEVEHAGGLRAWYPRAIGPRDIERGNLMWLKTILETRPSRPLIHLGYADEDRFVDAMSGLAGHLPPARVTLLPGQHDWEAWARIWTAMLNKPILGSVP